MTKKPSLTDWLLWSSVPLLTAITQVSMKLAAGVLKVQPFGINWMADALHCQYLWLALFCEILNFIIWLAILKRHALSIAFSLSSIGYVSVLLASWYIFNEPMQLLQLCGVVSILVGVVMIGYHSGKD